MKLLTTTISASLNKTHTLTIRTSIRTPLRHTTILNTPNNPRLTTTSLLKTHITTLTRQINIRQPTSSHTIRSTQLSISRLNSTSINTTPIHQSTNSNPHTTIRTSIRKLTTPSSSSTNTKSFLTQTSTRITTTHTTILNQTNRTTRTHLIRITTRTVIRRSTTNLSSSSRPSILTVTSLSKRNTTTISRSRRTPTSIRATSSITTLTTLIHIPRTTTITTIINTTTTTTIRTTRTRSTSRLRLRNRRRSRSRLTHTTRTTINTIRRRTLILHQLLISIISVITNIRRTTSTPRSTTRMISKNKHRTERKREQ